MISKICRLPLNTQIPIFKFVKVRVDAIDAANGELHCTVANSGVLGNKKGNKLKQ